MKLTFYGGAGDVTGANYLLEVGRKKFLIDCGLRQGGSFAERNNFERFAYDASRIDAVFVTHAHIDHIGRLPKLIRDGFQGQVYSTPPTKDFSEFLLLDSEHLLAEEAKRHQVLPLYDADDIMVLMARWHRIPYHQQVHIGEATVSFWNAGHILGSSIVRIEAEGKVILFSGDLGNYPDPIIQPTEMLSDADYCLVESAYGDRVHEDQVNRTEQLEEAVRDAIDRGGTILIPAFAMERTQDLLFQFNHLVEGGRIPRVPVFIDSPLAIKLTGVYRKYQNYFNESARKLLRDGDDIFNFPGLRLSLSREQSKEIDSYEGPKIIIAGSGMSNGGRILRHELKYLPDPKTTLLLVGYQAQGTLGRLLLEGVKNVRILGADIEVRASIKQLTGFSAHADQPRLVNWLRPLRLSLKKVFVVQGEPSASAALAARIQKELGVEAVPPRAGQSENL